jgi:type IV pilus assembly protein PilY1
VGQAAYYLRYTGPLPISANQSAIRDMANFQKIVVGDIAGVLGDAPDTGGFGVASAEKKQNFANWYAYYRNRINTMKTTAGRGFIASNLEGRLRIAYQTLWGFNGTDSARGDISLMRYQSDEAQRRHGARRVL